MKKKKGLIFSFVGLLVLTGIYAVSDHWENSADEETVEETETEMLTKTVSAEEWKGLTIHTEKEELSFEKLEDGWSYPADSAFPLDTETFEKKISKITDLSPKRILEEPGEWAEYGLDTPSLTLEVQKTDDTSFSYQFGDENSSTGDYYMRIEGEDTVYTISGTVPESFQFTLYDMAVMETLPDMESDDIKGITVKKDGTTEVSFAADDSSGWSWTMTMEDGTKSSVDTTEMDSLKSVISGLAYESMVDYQNLKDAEYGLDEPAAELEIQYEVTIEREVTKEADAETEEAEPEETESEEVESENAETEDTESKETETEDAEQEEAEPEDAEPEEAEPEEAEPEEAETEEVETEIVTEERTLLLKIGSCGEDGNYYVKSGDGSGVYVMDSSELNQILELSEMDYVNKTIQNVSLLNLKSLEVTYKGEEKKLYYTEEIVEVQNEDDDDGSEEATSEEDELEDTEITTETITHYFADETEVDSSQFQTFCNKLSALRAQRRVQDYEIPETEEPVLTVKYTRLDGTSIENRYYLGEDGLYTVIPDTGFAAKVNKRNVEEMLQVYEELIS